MNASTFQRVLNAVINDCLLDSLALKAKCPPRYNGIECAAKLCSSLGPDSLYRAYQESEHRSACDVATDFESIVSQNAAKAYCQKTVLWICQCMSVLLVANGERAITPTIPNAAILYVFGMLGKK